MASTSTGLLEWANDIRFSLANDPGRLAFQESVQEHGLLYLDDWFENLLQSSQQPETSILDLVKTPKRSQASPKKQRVPSKLQQALKFDGLDGQENRSPNRGSQRPVIHSKPSEDDIFRTPLSPPHAPLGPAVVVNVPTNDPPTLAPSDTLEPPIARVEPNLSSIAEDEEPSENKISPAPPISSRSARSPESRDTFHSIALDSPKHNNAHSSPPHSHAVAADPHLEDAPPSPPSQPEPIPMPEEETPLTQPADPPTAVHNPRSSKSIHATVDHVVEEHEEVAMALQPPPPSKPVYVSLPDPVPPVRKSSWLQKAREVKASDNTTRKYSVVVPPPMDAQTNMKRKSDVMLMDAAVREQEERLPKVAKRIEGDIAPVEASAEKPKSVKAKTKEPGSPAVSSPTAVGMLDMFKKTLGNYRFGLGKSLSGAAALNELAEARAAAEARLAEQEKSVAEATPPPPPTSKSVEKPTAQLPRSSQDRLSLSELAPLAKLSDDVGSSAKASALASGPVFVPPPPVFVHPSPPVFVLPRTLSTEPKLPPLSQKSSVESLASEQIFDSQPDAGPSTQETEQDEAPAEADDSWLDDKMPEGAAWNFGFNGKESVTWSSNATESQKLELVRSRSEKISVEPGAVEAHSSKVPGAFDIKVVSKPPTSPAEEFDELLVGTSSPHDKSLLGQTSQLASSVLDSSTSKKSKTELKSLQLAATKAKKEQEEKDKKAAVMKTMEQRRQQAQLRKAEEERARSEEKEKKMREETDRRKRERDEQTDKRPVKAAAKKDDDATKKRKAQAELEKQPESKKSTQASFRPGPSKPQASSSQPPPAAGPSQEKPQKATASSKAPPPLKSKMQVVEDDIAQPSQFVHSQMAARARLQLQQAAGQVASEDIELPDIASEYSDSDDEDRVKTFNPPDWAQSPFLRQQLRNQSTINPDAIFGPVQPLRMEDIFRGQSTRLMRPRSSSANWAGSDRLTQEEQRDYDRRMGYTQPPRQ